MAGKIRKKDYTIGVHGPFPFNTYASTDFMAYN